MYFSLHVNLIDLALGWNEQTICSGTRCDDVTLAELKPWFYSSSITFSPLGTLEYDFGEPTPAWYTATSTIVLQLNEGDEVQVHTFDKDSFFPPFAKNPMKSTRHTSHWRINVWEFLFIFHHFWTKVGKMLQILNLF